MSRLLRAGDITVSVVRKALEERTPAEVDPDCMDSHLGGHRETSASGSEREGLERRVAELEQAAIEQMREFEALEQAAYQRGMDDGIRCGAANVKRDHDEQLNVLRAGVTEALDVFRQRLTAVETLALDLTHVALEKIFGNTSMHAELVIQTARHHLGQLSGNSAIGVRVSAADFADAERLQVTFGLVPEAQHPALSVRADPHLSSGTCLIDLTLGRLDVSLPQQKAKVVDALEKLRADS
ncbi:hypothetical protein [Paraburkholderia sp. GAS82]|uniref:FliH/SctL family protein n=1 Tax=Paraburkholderia sp. GAS82 TaxID=3035137 RepID=UPI003D193CE7